MRLTSAQRAIAVSALIEANKSPPIDYSTVARALCSQHTWPISTDCLRTKLQDIWLSGTWKNKTRLTVGRQKCKDDNPAINSHLVDSFFLLRKAVAKLLLKQIYT